MLAREPWPGVQGVLAPYPASLRDPGCDPSLLPKRIQPPVGSPCVFPFIQPCLLFIFLIY